MLFIFPQRSLKMRKHYLGLGALVSVGSLLGCFDHKYKELPEIINIIDIDINQDQNTHSQTPDDNSGNHNDGLVRSVQQDDFPVTCLDSTIAENFVAGENNHSDLDWGCRFVTCESYSHNNERSYITVQLCNKPDHLASSNPQYFEAYLEDKQGPANLDICFSDICMDGAGFKRADFPLK